MNDILKLNNVIFTFWVVDEKSQIRYNFQCPVGEYFKGFPMMNYDLDKKSILEQELKKLIQELNIYFNSHPVSQKFKFPSEKELYPSEIMFDETNVNQLKNGFIPVIVKFDFISGETVLRFRGEFSWDV